MDKPEKKEGKMGLGANRDYKTSARAADRKVAKHFELMNEYVGQGMSRDEASKKAHKDVCALNINGKK